MLKSWFATTIIWTFTKPKMILIRCSFVEMTESISQMTGVRRESVQLLWKAESTLLLAFSRYLVAPRERVIMHKSEPN